MKAFQLIEQNGYLWGQKELSSHLSPEQVEALCQAELHDWLSALYWAEGIAADYALRMQSLVESRRKTVWERIYRDEVEHQLRVGRWLMDHGMAPLGPNAAVKFAQSQVSRVSKNSSKEELSEAIQFSQLFFEEYTKRLMKWRHPFVIERDLSALIYKILKDESYHIPAGINELMNMGTEVTSDALLRAQKNLLFPFHLARHLVKASELKQIKSAIGEIVERIFFGESEVKKATLTPSIAQFEHLSGYHCVACCPTHEGGLYLQPKLDNETGIVWDEVSFPYRTEGFNNLVHGGFITMALDEISGYSGILKHKVLSLTTNLSVSFVAPVHVGKKYRIEATLIPVSQRQFKVNAAVIDAETKKVCARSEGDFYAVDKPLAQKLFPALAGDEKIQGMFYRG